VRPRADLDGCGKPRPTGIRYPDRPARSGSLYRLSYPDPYMCVSFSIKQFVLVNDPDAVRNPGDTDEQLQGC
jgi:hypothetical protein